MTTRLGSFASFLIATGLILGFSLNAGAATAPVPGSVVLGFGESYSEGSATRTHRGVDIGAGVSAGVLAPLSGTVTFAGRIPADGGGSVTAVTLDTGEGLVSLLPLDHADVRKGQSVREGDTLGDLAGEGDGSSPAPHLHVGLRRGGVYADPTPLLGCVAVVTPEPEPAPAPEPEPAPAPGPPPAPAPVTTPEPEVAGAPTADPNPGVEGMAPPVADGVPAPNPIPGAVTGGSSVVDVRAGAATGSGRAPMVSAHAWDARSAGAAHPAAQRVLAETPGGSAGAVALGPAVVMSTAKTPRGNTLSRGASERPVSAALVFAVFLAVLASGGIVLSMRPRRGPRIENPCVSDRLGRLLQQPWAGARLRRLISCSGLSAFTDPGPLAQRR